MDVKITVNAETRRVTIWTEAQSSPADLGRALDGVIAGPDFQPGVRVLEILRGTANPDTVTRAIRSLGHRARRLGLKRWAIVTSESTSLLTNRTWSGITGPSIVQVGVFESIGSALEWLNVGEVEEPVGVAAFDSPSDATRAAQARFKAPSSTAFLPKMLPAQLAEQAATIKPSFQAESR